MAKEARIYNGEKTVSSISGAGKTRQLHIKGLIFLFTVPLNKISHNLILLFFLFYVSNSFSFKLTKLCQYLASLAMDDE